MVRFRTHFFLLSILLAIAAWPYRAAGQVPHDSLQQQMLKESVQAVMGTEKMPDWHHVAFDDSVQQAIQGQLRQIKNPPDTLYYGQLATSDGDFLLIPDIAPSRSEVFSFILYLDQNLEIHDVDVLAYRENYGYEIDYPMFRNQYKGKSKPGDVVFGRTIQNISGATISARSLTHAVHDLLVLVKATQNRIKP